MQILSAISAVTALFALAAMAVKARRRRKEARRAAQQARYWAEMCREIMDAPELPLDWRRYLEIEEGPNHGTHQYL